MVGRCTIEGWLPSSGLLSKPNTNHRKEAEVGGWAQQRGGGGGSFLWTPRAVEFTKFVMENPMKKKQTNYCCQRKNKTRSGRGFDGEGEATSGLARERRTSNTPGKLVLVLQSLFPLPSAPMSTAHSVAQCILIYRKDNYYYDENEHVKTYAEI